MCDYVLHIHWNCYALGHMWIEIREVSISEQGDR